MKLALIIYLIEIANNLSGAAGAICFAGFVVAGLSWIGAWLADDEVIIATEKKLFRISLFVMIASGTICIVTPSEETAYAMLAAYGVQSIAENEEVQKLAPKSLEMLNKAMDEYLQNDKEVAK